MTNIPPARWRVEKRTLAGFGIAIILLFVTGIISYRTIRQLADSNSRVTRSHRVLEHLFELNLDFDDLEAAARSFVITGDEAYFKDFNSGAKRFRDNLDELQSLTSANWNQRQRLEKLKPLIEHRLSLTRKMIGLRRSAGPQALLRMTEQGSGDEIVPAIRSGIKEMEGAQNEILAEVDSQAQTSANNTIAALTAACILVVLVCTAAAFINHRDMNRLRKADQALWRSQASLQDFLDNANDLIYSVSPDGRFLYVNRKLKETLGYTDVDLQRMSSLDIVHPDHRAQAESMHGQLVKGAAIDQFETVFLTKRGRSVVVSGNVNCCLEYV